MHVLFSEDLKDLTIKSSKESLFVFFWFEFLFRSQIKVPTDPITADVYGISMENG